MDSNDDQSSGSRRIEPVTIRSGIVTDEPSLSSLERSDLHNPSSMAARRAILEYAYRTTRERIARWMERHRPIVDRMGWREA